MSADVSKLIEIIELTAKKKGRPLDESFKTILGRYAELIHTSRNPELARLSRRRRGVILAKIATSAISIASRRKNDKVTGQHIAYALNKHLPLKHLSSEEIFSPSKYGDPWPPPDKPEWGPRPPIGVVAAIQMAKDIGTYEKQLPESVIRSLRSTKN